MAFTKIAAAGIGSTELVTLHSLEVLNNATVGGVLTYEDVTNVDSIGIITARAGVKVGSGITLSSDGDIFFTGIMTGNGSGLTGVASTDNIRTNTNATFLQNVNVSGTATVSDNVDIATSIRHIGDTDTKISFDTNIIHLDTNNAERLRILSNGTVIAGAQSISGGNRSQYSILAAVSNNTSATGHGVFTIQSGSNTTSGNELAQLCFSDPQGDYAWIQAFADNTTGATDKPGRLVFSTTADGEIVPTERLRITSTGSVGINQTDPSKAKLHVVAESGITTSIVAKFRNPQGASDVESRIGFVAGYSDTANDSEGHAYIGAKRNGSGNTASITFATYDGSSVDERIRINKDGHLLIGTTSLTGISAGSDDIVIGSIGDSTTRGITFATTDSAAIRWADAGDNAMGRISYSNSTDVMTFHTSNATRLRLDSDGMKFGSDSAAASALDDYEEGTFNFSLANVNAPTYEARGGSYVKIGRFVFGHGTIGISSGLDTSDGSGFQPSSLPFTATGEVAVTLGRYTNLLGGKASAFQNVRNTGTGFILQEGNDANICYNEINSSGYLNFTFAYYTTA